MGDIIWRRSGGALMFVLFLTVLLVTAVFPLFLLFLPVLFYHPPQHRPALLRTDAPRRQSIFSAPISGRGPPPSF